MKDWPNNVDSIRDTQDSIAAKVVSLKDIEGHIEHQIRNQSQIESNMQSLMSSVSCVHCTKTNGETPVVSSNSIIHECKLTNGIITFASRY